MNQDEVLRWLKKNGTKRTRDGMARYGIVAKRAFGVTTAELSRLRKRLGTDHELSLALWKSGWYEARLLAPMVGGFVLMACLALHDKAAPDQRFRAFLPIIEQGARDERNFVKKGVSWALRSIGRRNKALNTAAIQLSRRLAAADEASCRFIGKEALRELSGPKVRAALARRG
jgi:3-methyladenine DNA glycosylase AlkD